MTLNVRNERGQLTGQLTVGEVPLPATVHSHLEGQVSIKEVIHYGRFVFHCLVMAFFCPQSFSKLSGHLFTISSLLDYSY